MELNLERPLLFFDIESTGLNIATDCIAELSFVKAFPGGETRIKTWRFKPWDYVAQKQYPIHPQASAVNGLKDEDLKDCPRFCDSVDEVISWIADADLAGFNSAKFDLPMLAEEIERVRLYMKKDIDIDLHSKLMVDVQNIYHYMEPRNLKAAYRFYCGGEDFENAHTAEADTVATYEVLKGQLDMYPDKLKNDVGFHQQKLSACGFDVRRLRRRHAPGPRPARRPHLPPRHDIMLRHLRRRGIRAYAFRSSTAAPQGPAGRFLHDQVIYQGAQGYRQESRGRSRRGGHRSR